MTVDAGGVAVVVDDAGRLRAILGGHVEAALSTPFEALFTPADGPGARALLDDVRAQGAVHQRELAWADGPAPAVRVFSATRLDDGLVVVVGVDASPDAAEWFEEMLRINNAQTNAMRSLHAELGRVRREQSVVPELEALSALNNELAATQRELARSNARLRRLVEEKNSLLGMAAHDLRNPLFVVAASIDVVVKGVLGPLADTQAKILSRARARVEFMGTLINDMLDLSAVTTGTMRLDLTPIDLAALVQDDVDMMQALARAKDIRLECDVPAGGLQLVGDASKLRQVTTNLVSNAIKYSHSGTTARLLLGGDAATAIMTMADEGLGIPSDDLPRVFEPFVRSSVKATGGEGSTGLGLCIVKRIVEAHRGTITVQSTVGVGSRFTVCLPRDGVTPPA